MPNDLAAKINEFEKRVIHFGGSISASYDAVEQVTPAEKSRIVSDYIPKIIELSMEEKKVILNALIESWSVVESKSPLSDKQRQFWMRWGKAALGIAKYLLQPTGIDSVNTDLACDVVVRISRWYYTTTALWSIGKKPTRVTVATAWDGKIENFRHSS